MYSSLLNVCILIYKLNFIEDYPLIKERVDILGFLSALKLEVIDFL